MSSVSLTFGIAAQENIISKVEGILRERCPQLMSENGEYVTPSWTITTSRAANRALVIHIFDVERCSCDVAVFDPRALAKDERAMPGAFEYITELHRAIVRAISKKETKHLSYGWIAYSPST